MKRVFLAAIVTIAMVDVSACGEPPKEPEASAAASDSASAALPMAAPGEEAKLVEESPGLLARVKIADSEARVIALTRVSGGRIVRASLEEEDGRLVYSYELLVEAKPGVITEVAVDALTGEIASIGEEKAPR